jgi:amino acid transporter
MAAGPPDVLAIDGNANFGLRKGILSQWSTLAQSLSSIAPTATPAMVAPLVIGVSGRSSWLAYLLATLAAVLVAQHINVFARDHASPGSLYAFVELELGARAGVLTGWALLIAYLGTAAAVTGGIVQYVQGFAGGFLATAAGGTAVIAASVLIAGLLAYHNVEFSARFMLWTEAISVGLVLLLFLLAGRTSHFVWDHSQFSAEAFRLQPVRAGLTLAIFSFVGFESATALGAEAADPLRTIPRAVLGTAIVSGLFFVFSSYAEVAAFGGNLSVFTSDSAPLQLLARTNGAGWLSPFLTLGAIISFFACTLACITAAARTALLISVNGALPSRLARAHQTRRTPHVAVTASAVATMLPAVWLTLRHVSGFDIYGWVGTVATFGFITAYFFVVLAAAIRLHRRKAASPTQYALSGATLAFLVWTFSGSLNLAAPGPERRLAPIYLALLIGGGVFGQVLLGRVSNSPNVSKSDS